MKKFLLCLFLVGCSVAKGENKQNKQDASVTKAPEQQALYVKYKRDRLKFFYLPHCMGVCYGQIDDEEICTKKCNNDLAQIFKVLDRALKDGRENDFDDMMDNWYR